MTLRRAPCALAGLIAFATSVGCGSFGASDDASAADGGGDGGGLKASSDAGIVPTDCKALLEKDAMLRGRDGVYSIDPDGPGGASAIRVYCDLTLDDGGWTVVGRSSATAVTQDFGWQSNVGEATNVTEAYSLDVLGAKLTFTQIAVGDRAVGGASVKTHAYKFAVPPDFFTKHAKGEKSVNPFSEAESIRAVEWWRRRESNRVRRDRDVRSGRELRGGRPRPRTECDRSRPLEHPERRFRDD